MNGRSWSRAVARPVITLFASLAIVGCSAVTPLTPSPAAETAPTATASTAASSSSPAVAPSTAATASASAAASASASAAASPAASGDLATIASLSGDRLPARDLVELGYQYGLSESTERVARTEPLDVQVGDTQIFNVVNGETDQRFEVSATLRVALEHVLMYVEDGVEVDQAALERSARQFNDQIYDRNRELFGSEWTPGVDGDPRLTVLNARIPGVGGYFGGSDQVPRSANPFSNEREMFYINIDSFEPGTEGYSSVLAHEFQHMIEWHEQDQTSTWLNEGLSQLAEELNGFEGANNLAPAYLYDPDLQLTTWNSDDTAPHYAAAYLFMTYFYQQYQDNIDLNQLITQNAGQQVQAFADIARRSRSDLQDFGDVYADWSIANLLNDERLDGGRYSYAQLPETVEPQSLNGDLDETVAQFGSDYWEIGPDRNERVLMFDGSDTIGLVDAQPEGSAIWWSNRGDSAHTFLSRTVDLRDASSATLQYRLWYDLEDNYDYGFVSVSTDGGETFQTLQSRYTTTDDPQGYNYGNAYTGVSGSGDEPQWIDEQIDLTPYAGQEIVLRWSVITDDAVNDPGMALDSLQIPEIGWSDDVERAADGWTAEGFVRTDNRLPQQWKLRLVRNTGSTTTVDTIELDGDNRAEIRLGPGERGTLVVMATTPHTTERARYTLTTN